MQNSVGGLSRYRDEIEINEDKNLLRQVQVSADVETDEQSGRKIPRISLE